MPAATTRSALFDVTSKEYGKLTSLCSGLGDELALQKNSDGISIKDIIAHRAHWIGLFLGWYRDGQAGRQVDFPAPGYKWNQLNDYNGALRQSQAGLDWQDARRLLESNHKALATFIFDRTEDELYGAAMKGGRNAWTAGRWAEASGASHYRSAAKFIRARLRTAKP